jgi:enamine deaminase RidA (YjgF/YER057c/UK114 family)
MGAEARLKALGIELPTPPRPVATYAMAVRSGNLLFLSGHGPFRDGRVVYQGKVGRDLSIEQGQEAARLTGLNLLASVRDALGSLDRVRQVVKVLGMVQCADDFTEHPKVINGFSDLMVEVFGDAGRHARSAVGMGSLPSGSRWRSRWSWRFRARRHAHRPPGPAPRLAVSKAGGAPRSGGAASPVPRLPPVPGGVACVAISCPESRRLRRRTSTYRPWPREPASSSPATIPSSRAGWSTAVASARPCRPETRGRPFGSPPPMHWPPPAPSRGRSIASAAWS